ncbi:hypothetical protein B0H14DRAFT_2397581 [Mycena olivaceomarginata]|nr:hypothetical protein B0H14DRAFT_2397581 [Mycena olivaceomarginata]
MDFIDASSGGGGGGGGGEEGDEIDCRCGSSADDGFSIACDVCGRWCHAACFAISKESVPEEWKCWMCAPHNLIDTFSTNRNTSTSNRRRRASISGRPRGTTVEASPPLPNIDELKDERTQYVLIDDDIVPHAATQRKLRAYAQWCGVSALEPTPSLSHFQPEHAPFVFGAPPPPHPTSLHPCFPPSSSSYPTPTTSSLFSSALSATAPHSVLPPTYALHVATPAPPHTLVRYPSVITPTSAYLRAPTNGYAHAGAPKPFVHLLGPPLDVALDARGCGGRGRWVRSGCWPNAEVRAYVCAGEARGRPGKRTARDDRGEGEAEAEPRTHFGIFATRALKQGEEIVVGWEWDDGNAVHRVGEVAGLEGCVVFC